MERALFVIYRAYVAMIQATIREFPKCAWQLKPALELRSTCFLAQMTRTVRTKGDFNVYPKDHYVMAWLEGEEWSIYMTGSKCATIVSPSDIRLIG